MRIVSYNFLGGGSARRDAWRALERLAPDVLLGQECRPPPRGFRSQVWREARPGRWGTGLFSARARITPVEVPGFGAWVVGGDLALASPVRVFSIHCPAGERGYVAAMHGIIDALVPLARGVDVIVGGDLNVAAGVRHPGEAVRFGNAERGVLERIERDLGLIACWRTMHPRRPLAQTLRWAGNRTTPYHCDGIFVPRSWRGRLVRCEVVAGPRWDALSDHNPVVADVIRNRSARATACLTASPES